MNCPQKTVSKGGDLLFRDTLVEIRLAAGSSTDRLSVIEHRMPCGEAPPLHVHHEEDEVFYILRGTLRFEVAGAVLTAGAGDVVLAPKGVPHRFIVTSEDGAHCLTLMRGEGFESVIREVSRPAHPLEIYARAGSGEDDHARLMASLARHAIEVLGPPLAA